MLINKDYMAVMRRGRWRQSQIKKQNNAGIIVFVCLVCAFILLLSGVCHANKLDRKQCILSLIGEAEGESQQCRQAIAEVIRRRGSLKGVYGLHAPRVKSHKYSLKTWQKCALAWDLSAFSNYSCQATHWEGKAFKTPYWARNIAIVVSYSNTNFYR